MNGNGASFEEITRKYGTSLAETRKLVAELSTALKAPPKVPDVPKFLTSDEAKQYGVDIEDDWMLKLTPNAEDERGFVPSLVTPQGWEITENDEYISPDKEVYSKEEMQAQFTDAQAQQAEQEVTKAIFGRVFPAYTQDLDKLFTWANESPENLNQFYTTIAQAGRTPDTEQILKTIGASEKQITEFFGQASGDITEKAMSVWDATPLTALPANVDFNPGKGDTWENIKAVPGKIMEWLAPTKAGAGLVVMGAYLEKYVGRPWESVALGLNQLIVAGFKAVGKEPGTEEKRLRLEKMQQLIDKAAEEHGLGMLFASETSEAWEAMFEPEDKVGAGIQLAYEFLNPVYIIPIGGTAGKIANMTSKIPLIGKAARYAAAGVQAVEKGLVYPITKPLEAGLKGFEAVGAKLGEATVNQLLKDSKHLLNPLDLPASERVVNELLRDNWMKRALQTVAKLPGGKAGIEKALGWRALINREGQILSDVVGRGAAVNGYFRRAGINAAAAKVWELRAIEANPVRLFGFDKTAFSQKMVDRLLPEYRGVAEVGTLEHIFTQPQMYNFEGLGKLIDVIGVDGQVQKVWSSIAYVTRVHEINTVVLDMLKKEGVPPKHLIEDWIHRVVTGKEKAGELLEVKGKPGMAGRRVGAKPAYEKARQYETMADGIAAGVRYNTNPEASIQTYVEGAFNKVADARFEKYVADFGETAAERLAERYPEVAAAAELTKTELADAARFQSVVNRTIRGEKIPEATLKAMERRFPEMGRKLRSLMEEPAVAERQLREVLAENERTINELSRRLKEKPKAPPVEKPPEVAPKVAMPDEAKLGEAFKVMDYHDRVAFRSTMESQLDDIGRLSAEQAGEIEGIKDFLNTDPVATYRGRVGNRELPLTSLLIRGEWPETILRPQAELLLRGKQISPLSMTREGRVKWEYVINELAEYFNMTEDQLISRIEQVGKLKARGEDLKALVGASNERYEGIKRMLKVLDDVDVQPKFTPETPEAVAPKIPEVAPIAPEITKITDLRRQADALEQTIGLGESELKRRRIYQQVHDLRQEANRIERTITEVAPKVGIPKAEPGMPEAGLQKDIFGYDIPVYPKGKGEVTQMGMDDYAKLAKAREDAGLPPPEGYVKPKIEGLLGYEGETTFIRQKPEIPAIKTAAERKQQLTALRNEAKALTESRKAPYWKARAEKAFRMEQVRQPGIGEGYLPQPFAGGKIYSQEFIDTFNQFFGQDKGLPGLKPIADVAGILRITKAALDFSAMAIQGLPSWGLAHSMLLFDPVNGAKLMGAWYKGLAYSVGSFFDPGIIARYIEKNSLAVQQRVACGGSVRVVDYFAALQERTGLGGVVAKAMQKEPLKLFPRAETSFFAASEIVRTEFGKILSPKAIAKGQEFELARFLDRITGIADLSDLPLTIRQLEQSFVWFAPNYTRACLTVLADIFRGGYTGGMARKAIGGLIGAGAAMYTGVQYSLASMEGKSHEEAMESVLEGFGVKTDPLTGETTWKPNANFMTVKVGNYNFGFGGFWYGLLRLSGNIMAATERIKESDHIDLMTILKGGGNDFKDNPFIAWWYGRSSPFVGAGFELISGRDFLGYPIETPAEYMKYIATRFEPIWMEQGINWMIPGMARDNEIPEGWAREAVIPAELFGLRTFPDSSWVKFYEGGKDIINRLPQDILAPYFTKDELAKILEVQAKGKLEWSMLPDPLQLKLRSMYPELDELYNKAQADSTMRDSPAWAQWNKEVTEAKDSYYKRGADLLKRLQSGELDSREFRDAWSEAGKMYGITLDQIEKNPAFEQVRDYFDKAETKGEKYDWDISKALQDYSQVMFSEYTDTHGDFDFAARDKAIVGFIEKYGEDTYQIIREMYADKKNLAGLDPALIRLAEDKDKLGRTYWQLPWKPVYQLDEVDVPAQYKTLWNEYKELDTEAEREAFLEANPDIAKDWRSEYRLAHPEDDARLALWGYGGKLQSQESYDLVVKWSRELNIPLSQMGLGLPPANLINNYFEYNKIEGTTERKQYRQANPAFDEWGQDNYGWKPIEEQNVMPENIYKLEQKYNALPLGKVRLIFRHENPEYEDWLVNEKGFKPVGDRWMEKETTPKKTTTKPTKESTVSEAEKLKEFIETQMK